MRQPSAGLPLLRVVTGQAVPGGGQALGEQYAGRESWCFVATAAAAGALLREACTDVNRQKDRCEPKLDVLT